MSIKKKVAAMTVAVLALAGVGLASTSAGAADSDEGWHTWATTNESEPTSATVDWPQTYVGKGQLTPECGVWYQQDLYKEPEHGASIADVIEDGILTNGEDHHIVQEWRFAYGGDCPPEKPEPETGVDKEWFNECTVPLDGTRTHYEYTSAWTQDYVLVDGEWVLGERVDEEPVTTTEVTVDEDCIPAQPDTIEGEAVTVVYICTDPADGTGTTTTTTTKWTQGHSWDQDAGVWALDDKVYGDPVITTEVTEDAECIPDAPKSLSGTSSESRDFCAVPADGTRTYVMTETAWTQDYTWSQEAGQWVLGEKVYGEPAQTSTSEDDAECAVPDTPVDRPVAEPQAKPVAQPAAQPQLAHTGFDNLGLIGVAGLLAAMGLTLALVGRRKA